MKTGNVYGQPIMGTYYAWADLDHFAQSLHDAASWDGNAIAQLLLIHGNETLYPRLRERFGGDERWAGGVFSEMIASSRNMTWSALKYSGLVRGSAVDWEQVTAAERGTAYAAALRAGLIGNKWSFCETVKRRRELLPDGD